jgi:prepilin-type N-terminal cleavage/methylation domain-containing protein
MRGYSLLEVLVATSLVAVGVAALAHLTMLAVYANRHARLATAAAILAQQKMEDLVAGVAAGSATASPAGTLRATMPGYSDFVDGAGRTLGGGPRPPAGSVYLRRWSIDPLPNSPGGVRILQVLVTDLRDRRAVDSATTVVRLPGDARLVAAVAGTAF